MQRGGFLGNSLSDDITCLAADRMLVFAAAGRLVIAFARNKEVRTRVLYVEPNLYVEPYMYVVC